MVPKRRTFTRSGRQTGDVARAYREMAARIERFPQDVHYVQPFLPHSDETFKIRCWCRFILIRELIFPSRRERVYSSQPEPVVVLQASLRQP